MPIIPVKLLSLNITNVSSYAQWTENNPNDPWVGYDYQWQIDADVSAQQHSSVETPTPFYYLGSDIEVGDWIGGRDNGFAWKIISIISKTDTSISCIIEDVERYNTFTDVTQSGQGGPNFGLNVVFSIGQDGLPLMVPMSSFASILINNPAFQQDLISRFRYRNMTTDFYPILQAGNGFTIGDVIYMDNTGLYQKAQADGSTAKKVVGVVNSVGIPGVDYFAYKPIGTIMTGLTPALPGQPGDLIYVDPTTAGAYTATKPTSWAKPIYIQLEISSKGILLDQNLDSVQDAGYNSQTYQVADIAARDALTGLNIGDQVYVQDVHDGEWGIYIWNGASYTMLSNEDSSTVDSRTESIIVNYNDSSPIEIYRIGVGTRVTDVTCEILTAFTDPSATLTVGDADDNERLMDSTENDLSAEGQAFQTMPVYQYAGPSETVINAYFNSGTSTAGQARVTITYS